MSLILNTKWIRWIIFLIWNREFFRGWNRHQFKPIIRRYRCIPDWSKWWEQSCFTCSTQIRFVYVLFFFKRFKEHILIIVKNLIGIPNRPGSSALSHLYFRILNFRLIIWPFFKTFWCQYCPKRSSCPFSNFLPDFI